MAELTGAPAASPAEKKVSKPKKAGLTLNELIVEVVAASKGRSGVSFAFLKKALAAGGYDVEKYKTRVKTAVRTLVIMGTLIQTKGFGVCGSFKVDKSAIKKYAAATKLKSGAAKMSPKKKKKKKPAATRSPKEVTGERRSTRLTKAAA